MRKSFLVLFSLIFVIAVTSDSYGFVTELRGRGYSLVPAPQEVRLQEADIELDGTWGIVTRLGEDHIAVKRLREGAVQLHGVEFSGSGLGEVVLRVEKSAVAETGDQGLDRQAYKLVIIGGKIVITGNSDQGLFYGVQSLLQLMRNIEPHVCTLPAGVITDWPDLELRFIHWDTKHHQDRPGTLRRFLDWAAFFKVNCIGFEIEDKYEYPRHPLIGAPGAFTKSEMQELTAYALERFIQLVPVVQAPAHMAYVLKHEKFAHLRSDGSNYQSCMCDEKAIRLILDMYQDMIDATPGVKYFHVSTDEIYYAGICDKCKKEYNDENRSQAWADYANRVHAWLAERGRRMLAWVEYPLLGKHIPQLAPDLINGIMGRNPDYLGYQKKIGMRQLAYSSMQGSEHLFPNYFPTTYRGRKISGRLRDAAGTVHTGRAAGADPIGTFAAAWDDSGLHNETFWLGWATVTQYGWSVGRPGVEQNVADFMDVFYGPDSPDMAELYHLLIEGARFYEDLWDRVTSTERGPGYGNSRGKGIGTRRVDLTLELPVLPGPGNLDVDRSFSEKYGEKLRRAALLASENDRLIYLLTRNIAKVSRNRYNLEVLLSIAHLERFGIKTALALESVEGHLVSASEAARAGEPARAVAGMVEAYNLAGALLERRQQVMGQVKKVWEKSRFEKCRTVGGKKFVHVLDDVKDHFADRRLGLDYMVAPFDRMGLGDWHVSLGERINQYAARNKIPVEGLKEPRLED
ncbi:MAG: beta-N-acetylhexosaminidase [Gemmatimonadota bacterium]|nr:beta-N-acetylhexosaminidase [Gemmatimonadota bacterium]